MTKLVPLGFRGFELFRKIAVEWRSGPSIVTLVQKFAPEVIGFVQDINALIGAVTFQHLPEEAQVAAFDQAQVRWIQTSVNTLKLADPPLEVDGVYGTKTKDAVTAFQTAHGLTADGWAGKVTSAAMQSELSKLAPPASPAAPAAA